ncbi:50S ribosomal protein L1 [Candidatus Woesearchaeota archaeon]|nr:50S ribosomal protein L1 [Candidatus Woesearchaeota archaeon]
MLKENLIKSLKTLRERSPKRNFVQSFDFIVNLKDLDLKKPEHQLDFFVPLHYTKGKKIKICALVGPELQTSAKENCDKVILSDEFPQYGKDKKLVKKLASEFDVFIAQSNIMPQVAQAFGRVLGPRGKMPNPKAGAVVPPNANLKQVYEKFQKSVRVSAKTQLIYQTAVGSEQMKDEEIADNIATIYQQIVQHLPNEKTNIRSTFVKSTMGVSLPLDDKGNIIAVVEEKKK